MTRRAVLALVMAFAPAFASGAEHNLCAGRRAQVGMKMAEVVAACGQPPRIVAIVTSSKYDEAFYYHDEKPVDVVYLKNGVVVEIKFTY